MLLVVIYFFDHRLGNVKVAITLLKNMDNLGGEGYVPLVGTVYG